MSLQSLPKPGLAVLLVAALLATAGTALAGRDRVGRSKARPAADATAAAAAADAAAAETAAADAAAARAAEAEAKARAEPASGSEREARAKMMAAEAAKKRAAEMDAHAGHEHGAEAPTVTALGAGPAVIAAGPAGKLQVDETTFDGGKVDRGAKVVHAFVLKNVGEHDLTVEAKPGCGCTLVEYDKVIAPGKTGKVTASVDTSHFKGKVTKSVTVTTNDPAMPRTSLSISADISVPIDVQPSETAMFQGRAEALEPVVLTVLSTDGTAFDIVSATPSDAAMKVAVGPVAGETAGAAKSGTLGSGAKKYAVTVTAPKTLKVGTSSGTIAVKTTHPKSPDLTLRFYANVSGNIQIQPERVMMSPAPGSASTTQHVIVRRAPGVTSPLDVTKATSSDPRVAVEVETKTKGEEYDLAVTYQGEPVGSVPLVNLTVETNDALQPTLTIPVHVRAAALPGQMPGQATPGQIMPVVVPATSGAHGH
jgi:hypothetical protein